jgi:hypothetical protein
VLAPVKKDFTFLPVLFNFHDDVRVRRRIVKDVIDFTEMVFDVTAQRIGHIHVTTRVFKLHEANPPILWNGAAQSEKRALAASRLIIFPAV